MYHDATNMWKNLLQTGFNEDGSPWDWTTLGVQGKKPKTLKAKIIAKADGIWAAEGLVKTVASADFTASFPIQIQSKWKDGETFRRGDLLVEFKGKANELLALERPFLNLAAYASGIATMTRRFVDLVQKACPKQPPRVTLTRKTLPYYRDLSIHSVRIGGGYPHRVSLSGGVLIKENHIAAAGGIIPAIEGAKKIAPHSLKIEIEVRNEKEFMTALKAGAEGILLDNFTPEQVQSALKRISSTPSRPFIEVSGGLNEQTIARYAIPGVDILSVGALTHSARSVDLSFLVDE